MRMRTSTAIPTIMATPTGIPESLPHFELPHS